MTLSNCEPLMRQQRFFHRGASIHRETVGSSEEGFNKIKSLRVLGAWFGHPSQYLAQLWRAHKNCISAVLPQSWTRLRIEQ
jgi:hypothetical protein